MQFKTGKNGCENPFRKKLDKFWTKQKIVIVMWVIFQDFSGGNENARSKDISENVVGLNEKYINKLPFFDFKF